MAHDDDIASAETAIGTQPSVRGSAEIDLSATVIADRYEVLALLGVGGMGRVYRVHDRSLDEVVALKLLRRELLDLVGVLDRYQTPVEVLRQRAALDEFHRQEVVACVDAEIERAHDIGMGDAARELDLRPEPLEEVLRIARAACAGIAAAHGAGVLHRDLKPDNVLVARTGRVAITDFGIAQATGDVRDVQAGTPAYMAPEQIHGSGPIGPPTDVYAFGAILFEMLTGSRPFVGKDVATVMTARLTQPPPDPREHCVMPDDLAELVLRCLARDPLERLADGDALATALAAIDTARMAGRAVAAPDAVPGKTSRSIALLPLRASSDLVELAEGLSEEIVDVLTNTRELRVRPLGSVRSAARGTDDAQAIGRTLGVDVVVDGSVRRRGDQVRIGARAIGVVDGFQLWASHVDAAPANLLGAGDEIARAIARALTVELTELPARRAADPRATALYLENKARLRLTWDSGDLAPSIAGLERALELAPDEPNIVATLGMAHARAAFFGLEPDLGPARALAERAIALEPTSGEAHLALALTHLYATRVADAARSLAVAVSHAPGLARAQALLGATLLEANLLDEAIVHLEGAHAIDPLGPQGMDLPRAYFYAGRPAAEIEAFNAHFPTGHAIARTVRARFAMWRGETLDGDADLTQFPENQREYFRIADRVLRTRTISPPDYAFLDAATRASNPRLRATRAQFMVEFMLHTGDHERAIEWLGLSVDSGLHDHCWLCCCPMLAPLRGRDDFQQLAAVVAARAEEVTRVARETIAQLKS